MIVLHPGSFSLALGFAFDAQPHIVTHVIARRLRCSRPAEAIADFDTDAEESVEPIREDALPEFEE